MSVASILILYLGAFFLIVAGFTFVINWLGQIADLLKQCAGWLDKIDHQTSQVRECLDVYCPRCDAHMSAIRENQAEQIAGQVEVKTEVRNMRFPAK